MPGSARLILCLVNMNRDWMEMGCLGLRWITATFKWHRSWEFTPCIKTHGQTVRVANVKHGQSQEKRRQVLANINPCRLPKRFGKPS